MIQVTSKDFADYVSKVELASKPTEFGQVRLEMHTNPIEESIRYVIFVGKSPKGSRPIKKLNYALDLFNNVETQIDKDGGVDGIDGMILSANRFA